MKVERRNGNIWLASSLERFKNRYSVQVRDTFYFKHKGEDDFKVLLFGPTGIRYGVDHETATNIPMTFLKKLVTCDYTEKLFLPDEFSNAYARQLNNPVTLVGVDGKKWNVHWVLLNDSICFTDGWNSDVNTKPEHKMQVKIVKVPLSGSPDGEIRGASVISHLDVYASTIKTNKCQFIRDQGLVVDMCKT